MLKTYCAGINALRSDKRHCIPDLKVFRVLMVPNVPQSDRVKPNLMKATVQQICVTDDHDWLDYMTLAVFSNLDDSVINFFFNKE